MVRAEDAEKLLTHRDPALIEQATRVAYSAAAHQRETAERLVAKGARVRAAEPAAAPSPSYAADGSPGAPVIGPERTVYGHRVYDRKRGADPDACDKSGVGSVASSRRARAAPRQCCALSENGRPAAEEQERVHTLATRGCRTRVEALGKPTAAKRKAAGSHRRLICARREHDRYRREGRRSRPRRGEGPGDSSAEDRSLSRPATPITLPRDR